MTQQQSDERHFGCAFQPLPWKNNKALTLHPAWFGWLHDFRIEPEFPWPFGSGNFLLFNEPTNRQEHFELARIPDEDIKSGRHGLAECSSHESSGAACKNPVQYCQTIILCAPGVGEFYDTSYFCEDHKPRP